jgi:hypothetical protein
MHGVALPCGFIVGECMNCYASLGCRASRETNHGKQTEYRQRTPSDMSSAAISCPYCGTDALACNGAGKQDHTAIAALHGAERRLGPEQKAVLRRLLGWEGEGGGVEMGIGKEWRRDEDSYGDGEWELYEDADDFGGGSDGDETAEMSFDEVFEMGL